MTLDSLQIITLKSNRPFNLSSPYSLFKELEVILMFLGKIFQYD